MGAPGVPTTAVWEHVAMRPRRRPVLAIVVLVLSVAACGGATPSPGSVATPASPGTATLPASAPAGSVAASPGISPGSSEGAAVPTGPSRSTGAAASPATSAAAATPPTVSGAPATAVAWPVYHGNALRSGYDPTFPAPGRSLRVAWRRVLDGAVYGQPLAVGGRLLVATEGDSTYALDPASGAVLWRRHLGAPVPLATLPCGNIDPLGITSTPAYDAATDSLFVVAEVTGPRHVLFALDPASGSVRWSRQVDPPGIDPTVLQQRAALALGSGRVYVGFGGLAGDCGAYHGAIVGVPVTGHGASITYRVPTEREGAVWATGGPVVDDRGNVYVSVGNGSSTTRWDGSDSVLELSPTLELRSSFAPATWASDNAADLDLGSTSPTLLPGGWVFIAGKSGTGYVLRQGSLGGIGGQHAQRFVCVSFGATAHVGSTVYVPCRDGIREVAVTSDGTIRPGWHTSSGLNGPPVVGRGAVWGLDLEAGVLYALSPATGAVLGHVAVGAVPHFASPTLSAGTVFVGTMAGVAAVRAGS